MGDSSGEAQTHSRDSRHLATPRIQNQMPPTPSHRLPTDTDNGLLLIISGPSGAGKTTITRGVERSIADSVFSVSCTTRAKTTADTDGVDYHFIDDDAFEVMKSRDEFLETAGVYGKKYGTPKGPVVEQLRRGRLVILEIDVQGAMQIKKQIPEAFAIFILPPSEEELLRRLRDRKRESEEQITKRFNAAKQEIESAKASGIYNVFIVNDDVNIAIKRAVDLVTGERSRKARG
jgi:guanylate kinase